MTVIVATLFEAGDYDQGVAALLNSLVEAGYRGRVWCGVRGAVPSWLAPDAVANCSDNSLTITTVPLDTESHLAFYKPHFMQSLAPTDPTAASMIYIDPDIVVKCDWAFIERWCARGIAAVADEGASFMPASSPLRHDWLDFRRQLAPPPDVEHAGLLDTYCNSGFVGVSTRCSAFWGLWQALIDQTAERGLSDAAELLRGPRIGDWFVDQELFNIALMEWASETSIMGQEAMDFLDYGSVLSHAIGTPKPWQQSFVRSAVTGRTLSPRDWVHYRYRGGPFLPVSRTRMRVMKSAYRVLYPIGRVRRVLRGGDFE